MATISRTPPHYFLGNAGVFPSGEALRAAEAGLTSKAWDRARDNGEPVEEAMRLAFRLAALSPQVSSRDAARFRKWADLTAAEAKWRDPETRTESEHIDALMKQQSLGVPDEILWERVPYSPQEIVRIKAIIAERSAMPTEGVDDAQKALRDALALHAAHMDGTEPTSAASQQRLMDLIREAADALAAKTAPDMGMPGA